MIHAGLYYPEGSLKARFCVEGRKKLYAYCAERDVPHKRIGKLVVGVSDDEIAETLKRVIKHAEVAGVTDLEWLDGKDARAMEPGLRPPRHRRRRRHGCVPGYLRLESADLDESSSARQPPGRGTRNPGSAAFLFLHPYETTSQGGDKR